MARPEHESAMGSIVPPSWSVRPALRVRNLIGRLHRTTVPPALPVLEQMDRMIEVRVVAMAVDVGLIDAVAARGRSSRQAAAELATDPDATYRVMRYLISKGWMTAPRGPLTPGSPISLSRTGALLRADHPDGLRDWARFAGSPWMAEIFGRADHSLRTGQSATSVALGNEFFDFLAGDRRAESLFDAAMAAGSNLQGPLLARAYDFSGSSRLCDVGGGTGTMLLTALAQAPTATGVLFERAEVIDHARDVLSRHPLGDRVELVSGDMFESVPDGCDLYLLAAIVHDWDDESARQILARVAQRLGGRRRAVVVEAVVPDRADADFSFMSDVLMLVLTGSGRERTAAELHALFASAGLRVTRDLLLPNLFHAFELASI